MRSIYMLGVVVVGSRMRSGFTPRVRRRFSGRLCNGNGAHVVIPTAPSIELALKRWWARCLV